MKFNIGDTIRIVKKIGTHGAKIGDIGIIIEMDNTSMPYEIKMENDEKYWFYEEEIELLIKTKNDLQTGDIVTLRNGEKMLFIRQDNDDDDGDFHDLNYDNNNGICDLSDLNNNLTSGDKDIKEDVVKVERPINYSTVFDREREVKEMTVKQISEALGYEVKIVKEEE